MKVLIAILSCESYRVNGNNQAMRDTWLPAVKGATYKIFMGKGSSVTQEDEVYLDAPDGYGQVTHKAKALYQWADKNEYDFIFKCYPDTYVCPSRLMNSGFEKYDYSGNFACKPLTGDYCCGGTGYWTSHAAYRKMLNANIPTEDTIIQIGRPIRSRTSRGPHRPFPLPTTLVMPNIEQWAEDKWSGDVFNRDKTLTKHHDLRYEDDVMATGPEMGNVKITQHLSRPIAEGKPSLYDNAWLYAKHNAWLRSIESTPIISKIAVITPTLPSRSALLEECKSRVKEQSWSGEVHHAIGYDYNREGPSITRNKIVKGLDPSYEWLAFVDDDDLILPEHLSTLAYAAEGKDIIYSECNEEGFVKTWKTRPFDYESVKAENYIPVTVLMRRSVFDKVGGFPLDRYPGEDQWLFLNAASAGAQFQYVPKVTWTYRKHPNHR